MKHSNGFKEIASGIKGVEYGHVPGHSYHDVIVSVARLGQEFRAVALEVWGSAQGYDEEHGRKKVVVRGSDPVFALHECRQRAREADLHSEYLMQSYSEAEEELEEWLKKQNGAENVVKQSVEQCWEILSSLSDEARSEAVAALSAKLGVAP